MTTGWTGEESLALLLASSDMIVIKHRKAKFLVGTTSVVQFSKYENGRIRIDLLDQYDKQPNATFTKNLPDWELPGADFMFVKNIDENAGILQDLQAAGLVTASLGQVKQGHYLLDIVRLLKSE